MKKVLLLALPLMVMCAVSCEKEEEWTDDSPIIQFKDPKFLEALLDNNYIGENGITFHTDRNGDGQISEKEAATATAVSLSGSDIRHLDEIKYFTAITILGCSENQLTSLDVSKNTALTIVYCANNQLTSLDLSNNIALEELYCFNNQLTSLDLSNNTGLRRLSCIENKLTSLDLSKNIALTALLCSDNPLLKLILYKYHRIDDYYMQSIQEEYGNIIEYAE